MTPADLPTIRTVNPTDRTTPGFRRIAVVMAMHEEAEPIVGHLGGVLLPHPHDRFHDWYTATVDGDVGTAEVLVAVNARDDRHGVAGVGPEPAVVTTLHVLEHWSPDLVVSAGTAGGWASKGGSIGATYLGGPHVVRHDRRIDIPGFDRFGVGNFPCVQMERAAEAIGAEVGVVTSGGSLDESPVDRAMIEASGAVAKDMEAAAVAHVCGLWGTPFGALKVLTDLHDAPASTAEQFVHNLAIAANTLADRLVALLHVLAGAGVADLTSDR